MKYRKLRIAWSVTWGAVCVLLAVLWGRSYFRLDAAIVSWSSMRTFQLDSSVGRLQIVGFSNALPARSASKNWTTVNIDNYLGKDPMMKLFKEQLEYLRRQRESSPTERQIQALENKFEEYRDLAIQKARDESLRKSSPALVQTAAAPASLLTRSRNRFGFGFNRQAAGFACEFPYWLPVVASGVFTVLPWGRRRFSLRTLLIVTTLLAMGLGVIMWAAQ